MGLTKDEVFVQVVAGGVKVLVRLGWSSGCDLQKSLLVLEAALWMMCSFMKSILLIMSWVFGVGLTGAADPLGFGFLAFAILSLQDCQNCSS